MEETLQNEDLEGLSQEMVIVRRFRRWNINDIQRRMKNGDWTPNQQSEILSVCLSLNFDLRGFQPSDYSRKKAFLFKVVPIAKATFS